MCDGLYGTELLHGLRRACESDKELMQAIGFPTLVSNRIAYGIASFTWGGRNRLEAPMWAGTAADFTTAKAEHFDV